MKIGTHQSPKNYWGRKTTAAHTTVFRNLLFLLLLLLLSASGLLAQNFPPASNCTSKDLDMVEMLLQADQMGMDYQSGRRRMKVTVTNRTGTDRKSFVVWGTLNRYDSYGKFKSQEPLFVCVDNVQRNSTVTLPGKDSLYYNEDETIVVTNIYTAWSSASINESCETISADPSKIAPRCAVKQSLKVYTGVNARFRHLQGTCDNNGVGRVHARPFGGLGPYKVGIKNDKDESVALSQDIINEADSAAYDLPPGIYKLTMMDGKNNASVFTRVVDGPPPFASPEVAVNHPDCQLPKGLVKVMNRDNVAKYRLMQNGITLQNSIQEDQFADVESGDYELIAERGICRGQKKFSVLPRPFIPELPDVAVTHPDCIAERGKLKVRNPQASVKYFLRQNEVVLDSAAVDEFTAVASGEYQVEAKGLRCGLRNKVVVNPKPPRPDKPKLEKENPTCATPKGLIRLTNRDLNATYQLIRNGIIAPFNNNQDSVEAGDYSMVATRGACNNAEVVTVEARPFIPELPDVAVTHPDCIAERGKLKVRNPQASVKYFLRQNEVVLDSAAVDEFTAVASGEYQIEAKGLHCGLRNKVVVNPKPPRPNKPKLEKENPTCATPKGLIRLTNRDLNATYQLIRNGIIAPFNNNQDSVEAGDYSIVAIRGACNNAEVVTVEARPFVPELPDVAVTHPDCIAERGKLKVRNPQASVKYFLRQNEMVLDSASSDEFTAVASGEYQVEAKGLHCGLRNKVVVNPKPPRPDKPKVDKLNPSCTAPKGLVRLLNRDNNATYQLIKNGLILPFNSDEASVDSGNYSLVATRGICTNEEWVYIAARPFIPGVAKVEVAQPNCTVATGTISLSETQSNVNYFLSQNGEVKYNSDNTDFTGVATGSYQLVARHLQGQQCTTISPNAITVEPQPFIPSQPDVAVTQPDCIAERGKLKVSNAQASVKYFLRQNEMVLDSAVGDEFTAVAAGEYQVEAKGLRCALRSNVVVNAKPPRPEKPKIYSENPSCTESQGLVRLLNRDENATYQLVKNGLILAFNSNEQRIDAGTYSLVATRGICTNEEGVNIATRPFIPGVAKAQVSQPTCTVATGSISLSETQSNVNYFLSQNNEVKYSSDNTEFAGVVAGSYQLVARDVAGEQCITISPNVITVEPQPFIPSLPDVAVTQPDCIAERGKLKVSNAQASVKYLLRQNEMVLDSAAVDEFTAVAAGEYQVEAKGLRCALRSNVVVNAKPPRPEKPKIYSENPSCTESQGLVRLLNRDENATYQLVKNGLILAFNSNEQRIDAGTYSLVATRGICTNEEGVNIAARPFIPGVAKAQVSQPTCTVATGSISLSETQSNVNYFLSQNNEVKYSSDNTEFAGVVAGSYQLIARDVAGEQCITISPNLVTVDPQPLVPNAPVLSVAHPTCTNRNGYVTVSNKQSLVTYIIMQGSSPVATANGDGVFTDIAPGDYKVVAQAAICKGETVTTINAQPKTPTQPQLEITPPSFCNPVGAVKVVNPTDAGLQYSKDNGKTWQSTSTFADLAAGSGSSLSFVVSLTTGGQTCTSPTATVTCAAPASLTDEVGGASASTGLTSTSAEVGQEESSSEKKEARYLGIGQLTEATVTIKAVPNPFQTTVRFLINSPEAGRAVLDIFNGQGQLIKTVYQGYVYEGASYYDLILPRTQKNADLVYVFRIGNKVVTGKLIQLGNKF